MRKNKIHAKPGNPLIFRFLYWEALKIRGGLEKGTAASDNIPVVSRFVHKFGAGLMDFFSSG
ncbi:hypothetical protein EEX84_13340 [Planococcus salinus]|uniref:Uncharacterized protein n=1 Tax=Planococcus salinus TaxID=1848460 RepID=A0A3M8P4P7_9BACL|nr:hypothetical protein EEX84_13340 [Planococcus salinus]